MALSLNHITIRSPDLAACERFYAGLLGLRVGPRPPFPFPGLWLYAGDTSVPANAAVHIVGIERDDRRGPGAAGTRGGGAIDHVAFFASGLAPTLARLREQGVPYRERTVPLLGLRQVFVEDPHGIRVELNFAAGLPEA